MTITAWEGLVDRAGVREGHKVLVHGGAGGIGHVAVQIALARGAEVFATGGPRSLRTIKDMGAVPIDYTATDPPAYVAEHTGGEASTSSSTPWAARPSTRPSRPRATTPDTWSALWDGAPTASRRCRSAGATYSGVFTLLPMLTGEGRAHHGKILTQIAKLVDAGRLAPRVDEARYSLPNVSAAHGSLATARNAGKVVISIPPERTGNDYPIENG